MNPNQIYNSNIDCLRTEKTCKTRLLVKSPTKSEVVSLANVTFSLLTGLCVQLIKLLYIRLESSFPHLLYQLLECLSPAEHETRNHALYSYLACSFSPYLACELALPISLALSLTRSFLHSALHRTQLLFIF